ncbi:MAG: hypothetical protein K2N14_01190, partial [Clostridia bacterium]|nr:hypothetical protein [Clostridia bacterium]
MINYSDISLLSCFVTKYKEGERQVDVFDLIYETSKPYDEVKKSLDGLCGEGQVRQLNLRTYELVRDAYELEREMIEQSAGINTERNAERFRRLREKLANAEEEEDDVFRADSNLFDDIEESTDDDGIEDYYYEDDKLTELREKLDAIAEEEERTRLWSFNSLVASMKGRVSEGLQATLDRACQLVYYYKLKYATPEILVYAMMLSRCTACNVLAYLGVNFEEFGKQALASVDPKQNLHGFTMGAQVHVRRLIGVIHSDIQNKHDICSEHLLYELVANASPTAKILIDMGVDIDELREMLKDFIE